MTTLCPHKYKWLAYSKYAQTSPFAEYHPLMMQKKKKKNHINIYTLLHLDWLLDTLERGRVGGREGRYLIWFRKGSVAEILEVALFLTNFM